MDAHDPLLPAPDDVGWIRRPEPGQDPLDAAIEGVFDYINFNAVAWPVWDESGRLVTPPPEHVLDALARSYELAPEQEILTRPGAHTVSVVMTLPVCDLCQDTEARFDGQLDVGGSSAGAFFCSSCYAARGLGTLGATGDVYLMTYGEVPEDVRAICDEITARQGRESIWA